MTLLHRLARRLRADRRGLTSLELGLVALPLALVMFGLVEIGLAVRMKSALQYATAQAARCSVVDSVACGTTDATRDYAVTQAMGAPVTRNNFAVATAACGRLVTASIALPVVAHGVLPDALTLTARACYPT